MIESVLDAIEAGDLTPSHQRVAHLSGISERSVFRYFEDLDDMHAAGLDRAAERYRPLAVIVDEGHGSLHERIDALIEQRLRLWVGAGNAAAAMRIRSLREPALRPVMPRLRSRLRNQLARHLDGVLDGSDPDHLWSIVSTVEILVSYESFRLILEESATADDVRHRWRSALGVLLERSDR